MSRNLFKIQAVTILSLVFLAPSLASGIIYAQNLSFPITGPITPPSLSPTPTVTPRPVTPPVSPKPTPTTVPTPVTPVVSPKPSITPSPTPITPPATPSPSSTPTPVTPPTSKNKAPVITTSSLPVGHASKPYYATISFYDVNIKDTLKISIIGQPSWLKSMGCTVSTSAIKRTYTCRYQGVPRTIGFYPLLVTVSDQMNAKTSRLLPLTVVR